jgi:hypothetical protein
MVLDYVAQKADADKVVALPFEPNLTKTMYLVNNSHAILCPEALTFKQELLEWISAQ